MNEQSGPSDEAIAKATDIWVALSTGGCTTAQVISSYARALDESWNQGYSDCLMAQRIETMRKLMG